MTAKPLLSSTILIRVMTVFLFVLTQKRVMAPFNDNVLGLMRVMCGTRVTLLSFGTREYTTLWRSIIFHGRSSILLILLFFQTQDMFLTELNEHGLKKPLVALMLQIRSLHLHYHSMTGNVNLTDGK